MPQEEASPEAQTVTTLPIKDIKLVKEIYPRIKKNNKTIEAYAEALEAGAEFPPIIVQKILKKTKDNEEEVIAVIDGLHRLEAYKKNNSEEIEVEYWKEEIIDFEENINELKLEGAKYNAKHGDRLTHDDKKENATSIIENDKEKKWTYEKLGEYLSVPTNTVRNWTKHIRSRQSAEENSLIGKLKMLGWTLADIVSETSLEDQSSVSRVNKEFESTKKEVKEHFEKTNDLDKICSLNKIDEPLAWAIFLEGLSNKEKFDKLKTSESGDWKREEDVWIFKKPDDRFGVGNAKRTPGQIMVNMLNYFTNKNDFVVDLRAGEGTLVDACLIFERKCYAYDPNPSRDDIKEKDCYQSFPGKSIKKADLVYFEPLLEEGDTKSKHLAKLKDLIVKCHDKMKSKGKFAIMVENHIKEKDPIWVKDYWVLFEDAGFKPMREIHCPRSADDTKVDNLALATRSLLLFSK